MERIERTRVGRWRARARNVAACAVGALALVVLSSAGAAAQTTSLDFDDDAAPGEEVIVSGRGFTASEPVSIKFQDSVTGAFIFASERPVDDKGAFDASFTVPDRPAGVVDVVATSTCCEEFPPSAERRLTIVPIIRVDATVAAPGEVVGLHGHGWYPDGGDVTIHLLDPNAAVGRAIGDPFTDVSLDGTFDGDLLVPEVQPGHYQLLACQPCVQDEVENAAAVTPFQVESSSDDGEPTRGNGDASRGVPEGRPDDTDRPTRVDRPTDALRPLATSDLVDVADRRFSLLLNLVATFLGILVGARSHLVRALLREALRHPLTMSQVDLDARDRRK